MSSVPLTCECDYRNYTVTKTDVLRPLTQMGEGRSHVNLLYCTELIPTFIKEGKLCFEFGGDVFVLKCQPRARICS